MEDEGSVAPATAVEDPVGRTPADDERRHVRRGLGCLAGGLAGIAGTGVALIALLGMAVGSLTFEGCDVDLEIGPGDGKDSQRVAVEVAPTSGLDDGTTVFVTSEAFEAGSTVALTMCLAEAAAEQVGLDACDEHVGQRLSVDDDGVLRAAYAVSRVVTVDGEAHDCASVPERCILVAAWSGDYDLSGGQPLTFAGGLPPVDLVPSRGRPQSLLLPGAIAPTGPHAPGDLVTASTEGFVPGERVLVALCSSDVVGGGPVGTCVPADPDVEDLLWLYVEGSTEADAAGRVAVPVTVPASLALPGGTVRCADDPGRCGVAIAATADLQRSSYLGLEVDP